MLRSSFAECRSLYFFRSRVRVSAPVNAVDFDSANWRPSCSSGEGLACRSPFSLMVPFFDSSPGLAGAVPAHFARVSYSEPLRPLGHSITPRRGAAGLSGTFSPLLWVYARPPLTPLPLETGRRLTERSFSPRSVLDLRKRLSCCYCPFTFQ